jgi:hypothetical protein
MICIILLYWCFFIISLLCYAHVSIVVFQVFNIYLFIVIKCILETLILENHFLWIMNVP